MHNAIELKKRGFSTPHPIAFAEARNSLGILRRCWYVSKYEKSMSYAESLPIYGITLTNAFAGFVASLHDNGILHNDLNNSNVRVNVSPQGSFHFSLIDLNRMRIYPKGKTIPYSKWMKDICKFCSINNEFQQFAFQYLKIRHMPESLLNGIIKTKRRHDRKNIFLHKLKHCFNI